MPVLYTCCCSEEVAAELGLEPEQEQQLVGDIEGLPVAGKGNEEGSYVEHGLRMAGLSTAA